ncbi:hypothetical protein KSP39_PZI008163 [Platanthera zijinensis]|uniref:Uncharacterized protein n=1 Tax=Platanthera zijinensis TaxID=2320716 RepID=A0AAP0BN99_9ASPA
MELSSIKPPNLMKLSSKLVVKWMDGMSGSAPSYQDELGSLCRPEKVGGLGAKIIPNAAAAAASSADPVERKLQRKVYAIKKKSAKDSEKMIPSDDNRLDGEDDQEPESRIKALSKRKALPADPPQRYAKKINK